MINSIKINMILIGIILSLFGIFMLVAALIIVFYERHLRKEFNKKSKAKILKFNTELGSNSSMPVYELVYEDTLYELRSIMGAVEHRYKEGDIVKIWFDSENPYKFITEVELNIWSRLNLMFRTLGIYAIAPGILFIIISILIGVIWR